MAMPGSSSSSSSNSSSRYHSSSSGLQYAGYTPHGHWCAGRRTHQVLHAEAGLCECCSLLTDNKLDTSCFLIFAVRTGSRHQLMHVIFAALTQGPPPHSRSCTVTLLKAICLRVKVHCTPHCSPTYVPFVARTAQCATHWSFAYTGLLCVLLRVKHSVHLDTCRRTGRLLRVHAHLVLSLIHRPFVARAVAR
jgi:hypothetical protein